MKNIAAPQVFTKAIGRFGLKTPLPTHFFALFLALAGTSALTGCGTFAPPPARATTYDFGPPPAASAAVAGTPIALGDVDAPSALDNTAVLYRLGYADAQQPRPYAQARWSMAPAQLVRQRVRDQLSQTRPVLNPGEASAQRTLRVELEEFNQWFESPSASIGRVRLRATLLETTPTGEKLLAQRNITTQRPATSADAAGGVRALTAATDAAIVELDQWLAAQPTR